MRKLSFRVVWTETATRDLESLLSYIAREASINAGRVLDQLQSKTESLTSVPERGRLVPELLRHGLAVWRELIVKPYRLLYRIDGQTVYVLAVLDARRDLEDVLLERLLRT
jgi:toxin ParE1/3/4